MSEGADPRRVRLEDVAAHLGMSTATVSLALRGAPGPSEQTRKKVLEAVELLGYRPDRAARALAQGRSLNIGVVMDLSDSFQVLLVEALYEANETEQCEIVLSAATRSRSELRAAETLLDSRCEVLILLGPHGSEEELLRLSEHKPLVCVGRNVRGDKIDVVRVLDAAGVGMGIRHLIDLGHARIAYADAGRGAPAKDRREGYLTAMQVAGLGEHARVLASGHSRTGIDRTVEELLRLDPRPTAVATSDDECAVALVEALGRAGVDVPGQISVIGFDDSPVSRMPHVQLSTVSQAPVAQARAALATAAERLRGERTEPVEIVLQPRIVARTTTAPPAEVPAPAG